MKSHFTSYDLKRLLISAAKRFKQEIHHDCQKRWIHLDADPLKGQLSCYDFEDGVQLLLLNGVLTGDWEIEMASQAESPFLLYFNVRGEAVFNYQGLDEPLVMEPMKTIMVSHPSPCTVANASV